MIENIFFTSIVFFFLSLAVSLSFRGQSAPPYWVQVSTMGALLASTVVGVASILILIWLN